MGQNELIYPIQLDGWCNDKNLRAKLSECVDQVLCPNPTQHTYAQHCIIVGPIVKVNCSDSNFIVLTL